MPPYHLIQLDRQAYILSTSNIADEKTLKFSKMSLEWWDSHFFWSKCGCMVLADENEQHLCYIFYKIDRYRQYMTIHNIFTPLSQRRKGYAHELLKMVFNIAVSEGVGHFKLTSISKSLDFYLALSFIYWGINSVGDYYCDLPIPLNGLAGLEDMTNTLDMSMLVGLNLSCIFAKVKGNDMDLDLKQTTLYKDDKIKMNTNYKFSDLSLYYKNTRS